MYLYNHVSRHESVSQTSAPSPRPITSRQPGLNACTCVLLYIVQYIYVYLSIYLSIYLYIYPCMSRAPHMIPHLPNLPTLKEEDFHIPLHCTQLYIVQIRRVYLYLYNQ